MRVVLGLLCFLSLTCNAPAEADPASTRADKLAAAEAIVNEISSRRLEGKAEGLPDGLAQAVDA